MSASFDDMFRDGTPVMMVVTTDRHEIIVEGFVVDDGLTKRPELEFTPNIHPPDATIDPGLPVRFGPLDYTVRLEMRIRHDGEKNIGNIRTL